MVDIQDLEKTFKRSGDSNKIKDFLLSHPNKCFNYDDLQSKLLIERTKLRVLINQLVRKNKINKGYKENIPYVYIIKKE